MLCTGTRVCVGGENATLRPQAIASTASGAPLKLGPRPRALRAPLRALTVARGAGDGGAAAGRRCAGGNAVA